jgi:hypothetical protein
MFQETLLNLRNATRYCQGNALTGRGAAFAQMMQNTRELLQKVSLDDPQSVWPHFTSAKRNNLRRTADYLTDLRCTSEQVAIEAAAAAENPIPLNNDAEDLAEVAQALRVVAEEVFQLRSLFILIGLAITASVGTPLVRRWVILRKRRSKRHNVLYETQYRWNDQVETAPLLDINCFGTKLRHNKDDPLREGESVEVSIEGNWQKGTVMWSNANYCGVQFLNTLSLLLVHSVCDASNEKV